MSAATFKQSILPLFEEHRAEWLEEARSAAYKIGCNGGKVTIDDVRRVCPPPVDVDPRVMGAVFLRNTWRKVGYMNSRRKDGHGRHIVIFELK
jgi:hypothetical protein